jgi:RimJ/RimL family protein N-acetyltransferase
MSDVHLRDMTEDGLSVFFEQQLDPAANQMAAFTAQDPADKVAFTAKWTKNCGDGSITKKTVLFDGQVAGSVVAFVAPWSGKLEVSYWIGREFWGKGIATKALSELIGSLKTRSLYARTAKDNLASIRVLEKCGFTVSGYDKGFANARGEEIEEVVLELKAKTPEMVTLDRVADLSDADRERVRVLSLAVYPPEQFTDWPGRRVEWSIPEWCVRVRDEEGILVSYVGVYVREAECDGQPVRVAGIGNVKTHPGARRRGFAGLGIRRAVEFFRERPGIAFALLVCEPRLLGYYARLGWREFCGRLLIRQYGAASEFTLNRVMTYGLDSDGPAAGVIDLCGPPW